MPSMKTPPDFQRAAKVEKYLENQANKLSVSRVNYAQEFYAIICLSGSARNLIYQLNDLIIRYFPSELKS